MPATPRRRSTDPELTRKGGTSHPGTYLLGLVALLFTLYIFDVGGLGDILDGMFNGATTSAHSHDKAVSDAVKVALPIAGALIVALVLYNIAMSLGRKAAEAGRERKLASREVVTLEQFLQLTAKQNIAPGVAREAYRLLVPYYRNRMRTRLSDRLDEELGLSHEGVIALYEELLYRADRQKGPFDENLHIATVQDLLVAAHSAAPTSRTATSTAAPLSDGSVVRPGFKMSQIPAAYAPKKPDTSANDRARPSS